MRKQIQFIGFLLATSFVVTSLLFWIYEQGSNPAIRSVSDVLCYSYVITNIKILKNFFINNNHNLKNILKKNNVVL